MFKNVKNAWSDWFKGTTITPVKTTLKHPVCSIIWVMIGSLPFLIYCVVALSNDRKLIKEMHKPTKQTKNRNSYRSYDDE